MRLQPTLVTNQVPAQTLMCTSYCTAVTRAHNRNHCVPIKNNESSALDVELLTNLLSR